LRQREEIQEMPRRGGLASANRGLIRGMNFLTELVNYSARRNQNIRARIFRAAAKSSVDVPPRQHVHVGTTIYVYHRNLPGLTIF
jgi:hypothetical protein